MKNNFKGIALFAGCGGFSLGMKEAGIEVVGMVEIEKAAREIYKANNPATEILGTDITQITEQEIKQWKAKFEEIDVLFGGPPCQGFSLAGKRDENDPRNTLFLNFAKIAKILQPKVIVLENVRVLTSMKFSDNSLVIDLLLKSFDEAGYNIDYKELNAQNYGVPQFRERVFFIGVRKDLELKPTFPIATHSNHIQSDLFLGNSIQKLRTFRDACGQLESLESGEKSTNDLWHFAITHPKHVIQQLKDVPEGESAHNNLNPELRPKSGYNTTYKRIRWDEPCSTISTTFAMISGSRNVHPTNTRSFTIREAMRVQTFPDDFKLLGTLGDIRTAIGNAVPPLFAKVLGEHIIKNILNNSKDITLNLVLPKHKNNQLVS